ncbi:DinB family protein [Formosa sp. S-31]|uniref:DinB family protein n=1 Tax=Formosa sp. S-31 TaxID=2790949 RepID=UPI003EBADBBA
MKGFLKDLFNYHHHFNQLLIKQCLENSAQVSVRAQELLSHCFNAHQIWNARIIGETSLGVNDLHTFKVMTTLDESNLNTSLRILETMDINTEIVYTNSKGEQYTNTIKDILFHITNHFSHHKGQIILELKQGGITPLVTDYIFYKRNN